MSQLSLCLLVVLTAACVGGGSSHGSKDHGFGDGTSDGTGDGGTGDGGGDGGSDPGCTNGISLAADATKWSLPEVDFGQSEGDPPFEMTGDAYTADCGSSRTVRYTTFDINGDGPLDLVLTRQGCDGASTGTSKWLVYEGGAKGFADSATSWSLPSVDYGQDGGDPPFESTADAFTADCGSSRMVRYVTMDLTGDGVQDLVVTRQGCDGASVGRDHWLLYKGGTNGFADSATKWTLPPLDFGQSDGGPPFEATADSFSADCASDRTVRYATFDITGDGIPDLVMTRQACDGAATGRDHWLVYKGGSSGFAESATKWTLPAVDFEDSAGDPPFENTADSLTPDCGSGRTVRYTVLELTGDGILDLVLTRQGCEGAAVGRDYWLVYEGGSKGFAADAARWDLPPLDFGQSSGDPPIETTADAFTADCGSSRTARYTTLDLTGDGLLDLVFTRSGCDGASVGTSKWLVYPSDGSGFAAESETFALPELDFGQDDGSPPFENTSDSYTADCGSGRTVRHALFDLDGNAIPDMVFTREACDGATIGTSRWDAWLGDCK